MKPTVQPDPRDYEIRIWYSAEKGDECFVAQVVESSQREAVRDEQAKRGARREQGSSSQWPGIMAHGETREEAARQIQLALESALETAAESGIKPPRPGLGTRLMIPNSSQGTCHSSLFLFGSTRTVNGARGKRCDMDKRSAAASRELGSSSQKLGNASDLDLLQKTFDRMK